MICPHCSTAVKYDWNFTTPVEIRKNEKDENRGARLAYSCCPHCGDIVVNLHRGPIFDGKTVFGEYEMDLEYVDLSEIIYPRKSSFQDSEYIPNVYLQDYEEAVKILTLSPKASAALTRRILQHLLREEFKIKERTLSEEIIKFSKLSGIPSHLTGAVDAIRNVGNFAAHPSKDESTGEIVNVEVGEAEWLIEIIEALFDFAFIQPIKLKHRKEELNARLKKIGKPEMK